jgi:hypothetical protein
MHFENDPSGEISPKISRTREKRENMVVNLVEVVELLGGG